MSQSTPTSPNRIKAVLFDYGMVLSGPPNAQAWSRLRDHTGLTEQDLQREYWAHRHAYDRGTYTGEAYFQQVASGAGLPPFAPETVDALLEADTDLWTDLNQPMLDWADFLQRKGVRTGILSNLGDSMHAGLLRKFSWLGSFDHCTWSHTLKLAKPEIAIYRHAAEGLQTPPEQVLFVDDKIENVAAAEQAGMLSIQYLSHPQFIQEMSSRGMAWMLPEGDTHLREA